MDKIKAFFQKTAVKVSAWILLVIATVVLIVGGATADSIKSSIVLVAAIITAVSALVAFICGQLKD